MPDAIATITGALRAEAEGLRLIAENVANASSVGHQRQIPIMHVDFAGLLPEDSTGHVDGPIKRVAIDLTPGPLQQTEEPLHVALDGPGYFVVTNDTGDALTRAGDWRLDAEGYLVTRSGAFVQGVQGPVRLSGPPSIELDGSISVDGIFVDRLRVISPSDSMSLEALSDGLFRLMPGAEVEVLPSSRVRQGFLELSNTSPVNEMVQLMDTLRRFELMQRVARGHDAMLEKAISELGKP